MGGGGERGCRFLVSCVPTLTVKHILNSVFRLSNLILFHCSLNNYTLRSMVMAPYTHGLVKSRFPVQRVVLVDKRSLNADKCTKT